MAKRKMFILIFITAILIVSISANCFDRKPGSISMGDYPEFSYVKITTIGSAIGLAPIPPYESNTWKKSEGSFLLQGVGFVTKGEYIITAAHVVHPTQISTNTNKYALYIDKPIKILQRSIIITADIEVDQIEYGKYAKIYYLDINQDIAILKFKPDNVYESVPYELSETKHPREGGFGGYYSLLRPGDSVAVIVRCRDKNRNWMDEFEIRYGKIISNGITGIPKSMIPAFNMNDFTTDIKIHPGDSGTAIFAFSFGKPVIIGIIRANNDQSSLFGRIPLKHGARSYATRIDFVKKILESR